MRDNTASSKNRIYNAKSRRSKYQEDSEKEFFARRIKNRFRRSFKAISIIAFILLIAAVTYLVIPSTRNQLFTDISNSFYNSMAAAGLKVKEITIEGVEISNIIELSTAHDIEKDDPILGVDINQVKENFQNISWVKDVNVRRILPNNIQIKIVERKPIAVWQNNKKLHLIDQDGVVITEVEPDNSFNFPLIVGENSNKTISSTLSKFHSDDPLTKRIKILQRYGDRRWDVTLDNGIVVKLPATDEEIAWQRLSDLDRKQDILSRYITEIDLRYNDKVFIKLPNSEIIQTLNTNS